MILLSVRGQRTLEGSVLSEAVKQGSPGVFRRQVLNNENRGGNVGRQLPDQCIERFQASCRSSNHDDVTAFDRQRRLRSLFTFYPGGTRDSTLNYDFLARERREEVDDKEMPTPEAAVAIVRARTPQESVLLIRRAEREEDSWAGHWCFPGGRREPEDGDLLHTALRELEEECGIRLGPEDAKSELPSMWARRRVGSYVLVSPFLFQVESELPTVLAASEAIEAVWIPVSVLLDPARHALLSAPGQPAEVLYPGIVMKATPLWGFTYRLITDWLGLWPKPEASGQTGADAASRVLRYLVSRGLTMRCDWKEREVQGRRVMAAAVSEKIPAAAVLAHFSDPREFLPAINVMEVRPDFVRLAGPAFEEYFIYAGVKK
jgi:8-oxo-dGTP pyrophosphatase MutT (NUDIX family)